MDTLELLAKEIAYNAHDGQFDKAGLPYITHVERVVARLVAVEDRTLAWLHDVIEDTYVTAEMLQSWGFPPHIVTQVEALTHLPGEPRDLYYQRILQWPAAVRVKLSDVADNSDPNRLFYLDEPTRVRLVAKYEKARMVLSA